MITAEISVGRLIEVRIASPIDVEQVASMQQRLQQIFGARSGKFVVAVDLRAAGILAQELSDAFLAVMRKDNPRFERNGYFISESAIFALQIERLIREANSPTRKASRTAAGIVEWLGPLLSAEEKARLEIFLAQKPDASR